MCRSNRDSGDPIQIGLTNPNTLSQLKIVTYEDQILNASFINYVNAGPSIPDGKFFPENVQEWNIDMKKLTC
jgi:hypothetical protein